jgi:uncharacterized protein YggE
MNLRQGLTALVTGSAAVALMSCGSASPVGVSGAPSSAAPATAPPATAAPAASPSLVHTLLVTGTGTVSAPPDEVDLSLGVDAQAANAPLAMNQANADMARLLASLKRQGVQPADISTSELSLYRDYNSPYQASQSVDVTIHHIGNAGSVISAAMNTVGNDATVSGVTYSIHDPSTEVTAARQKAMADARVEALQLAQLAGHSLGAVVSVADQLVSSGSSGGCSDGCGGGGGSVPLSPGVDQVSVTIYVTYSMS